MLEPAVVMTSRMPREHDCWSATPVKRRRKNIEPIEPTDNISSATAVFVFSFVLLIETWMWLKAQPARLFG